MSKKHKAKALAAIESRGIMLVFPINNAKDPHSIWNELHPRKKMRWEWDDDDGDNSVFDLWHLRTELALSRQVVYTKWYRGRATFFSLPVFRAFLTLSLHQATNRGRSGGLSTDAKNLLAILEEKSPRSTKELKKESGLVGRALEPSYQKALKQLWESMQIVAYGEVDDGAFPSLAIGATSALFEDLFLEAKKQEPGNALALIKEKLASSPAVERFFSKTYPKY